MTPDQPFDNCEPCETPVCNELGKCFRALPAEPAKWRIEDHDYTGELSTEPAKPEGETLDENIEMILHGETGEMIARVHLAIYFDLKAELAQLRAENERMREDTERMDWMEREGHSLEWSDQCPGVMRSSDGKTFFGDDLREAISAAIRDELPAAPTEPTYKEA